MTFSKRGPKRRSAMLADWIFNHPPGPGLMVGLSAVPRAEGRQVAGRLVPEGEGELGAGEVVEDVKVVVLSLARILVLNKRP